MKGFWASLGGQIAASLAPIALVAVVAYFAWRKLFGAQTPSQLLDNVTQSAESIPSGLASLAESKILGQSEDTYISQDEAKRRKALIDAQLAAQAGGL